MYYEITDILFNVISYMLYLMIKCALFVQVSGYSIHTAVNKLFDTGKTVYKNKM